MKDETLEIMVDRKTLKTVLDDLAIMCAEKAEHVRVNWQDERTAKAWTEAHRVLASACSRVRV